MYKSYTKNCPREIVLVSGILAESNRSGGTEADERIDIRGDGRIILYKREGLKSPAWQARTRVQARLVINPLNKNGDPQSLTTNKY